MPGRPDREAAEAAGSPEEEDAQERPWPESGRTALALAIFCKFCKFFAGSFSAVSKRIFARNCAGDSIFQDLQDLHPFAPLQSQNFSKNQFEKSAIFVKIENSANIKHFANVTEFANICQFSKFQIDNLVDFEKCCKTRVYTPPLGGQKTQAYCLAPQKNLLTGCVSKPFSKQMWRPEMR